MVGNFPITNLRIDLNETFLTKAYFVLCLCPLASLCPHLPLFLCGEVDLLWTVCAHSRSPGMAPAALPATSIMDFLHCLLPGSARSILGLGNAL